MPWHFLYFLPEPHGHISLRPTLGSELTTVLGLPSGSSPAASADAFALVKVIGIRRLRCMIGGGVGELSFGCCDSAAGGSSLMNLTLKRMRVVSSSMRSIMVSKSVLVSFLYSTSGSFWP